MSCSPFPSSPLPWLSPFMPSSSWSLSLVWILLESGTWFSGWHLRLPLECLRVPHISSCLAIPDGAPQISNLALTQPPSKMRIVCSDSWKRSRTDSTCWEMGLWKGASRSGHPIHPERGLCWCLCLGQAGCKAGRGLGLGGVAVAGVYQRAHLLLTGGATRNPLVLWILGTR